MIMDITGLFSFQLLWLEKLREFIDTNDDMSELPALPQSQLSRIVAATGNRRTIPPLGVALLNPGFSSGYFALTLYSGFKCICINLTVENSSQLLPTKVLHGVTKPLRKEPVPFEYLASPQTPLNSLEVWALLTSAIAHLRKEYVGYISGCEADANDNFAALNSEIAEQNKNLQYERQRIAAQVQQSERIEKRIAGCLKVQEHAAKRIKNIFAITTTNKMLSKAERDLFKELYEYYYIVHTKLRSKLEELSYQTQKELRKLKVDERPHLVPLNEEQLNQISTVLQGEYPTRAEER